MYSVTDHSVLKAIDSWAVTIPLHDNDGQPFESSTIQRVLDELSLEFSGFTVISCVGHWRDGTQEYVDRNIQIIIDTIYSQDNDPNEFIIFLKKTLSDRLGQEKIYITLQQRKSEVLSFDEFFQEVGLEQNPGQSEKDKQRIAKQIVQRMDFILQRLQYETTVLRRDSASGTIIWERRLCGLLLRSEWTDAFPPDLPIIAADNLDDFGNALINSREVLLVGLYEYQAHILENRAYRPIIKVDAEHLDPQDGSKFVSQSGDVITFSVFIEQFIGSIISNYIALREEGFIQDDIKVNVGSDGSMQVAKTDLANIICYSPAVIRNKSVQIEIIQRLMEAVGLYERNEIDPIALLQAKAKNRHIATRAMIRHTVREHRERGSDVK